MKIKKFSYFFPEKPTLVSIEQDIFNMMSQNDNWIAEPKYNGSRLQLHLQNGKPEFWSRHGEKLAYQPTDEILDKIKRLFPQKGYYLFDGELLHNKVVGVRNKIIIYDVYIKNNELLIGTPFRERRQFLESFLIPQIGIPLQYKTDFKTIFNMIVAESEEFEGLVMKNQKGQLDLGRSSGQKSKWMKKVRRHSNSYNF